MAYSSIYPVCFYYLIQFRFAFRMCDPVIHGNEVVQESCVRL